MKKILATALMAAMVSTNISAQSTFDTYYNTKHELGITIGSAANTEIFSGLADLTKIAASAIVTTAMTGGIGTAYYDYGDASYIPTLSVEYYYHVNKVIGLGGFVSYNGLNRDMYFTYRNNTNGASTKEKTGEAKRRNLSIIPTAKFDWLRMKHIGLYSKLGAGISTMHESQKDDKQVEGSTDYKNTDVIFNFHVSLLGFEAGSENFRGFVEAGMGEQGIVLAGMRYKF